MESITYRCWSRNHLGTLGICRCCAEAPEELGSGEVALKSRTAAAAHVCRVSAWLNTRNVCGFSVCMLA